jgi:hypothetical protein
MDNWENCPNAYVAAIVTDEDATTLSKLSHSKSEMVVASRMMEAERRYTPENESNLGAKKPDHGELPLDHPFITKLSDPIHYVKNYKCELYQLVHLAKAKAKPIRQTQCG